MAATQRLNNIDHANLCLGVGYSAAYGDNVNQAVVFPTEYQEVQREYPILIQKTDDGGFESIAILGLESSDENLFLSGAGWNARYVPAIHQRGPFMIGFEDVEVDGEIVRDPMIHIDMDHPRVKAKNGVPVFLKHGGNAPLLDHMMRVLQIIHQGAEISRPMFAAFDALGLLQQVSFDLNVTPTDQITFADYYSIREERFNELDGAALLQLHQAGYLQYIYYILSSFVNFKHLVALKHQRQAGI